MSTSANTCVSVFYRLSETEDKEFPLTFINSIEQICQYEKTEITDFICTQADDSGINRRISDARLALLEQLQDMFPECNSGTLYARKKLSLIADDIYSVVNNSLDTRLQKVFRTKIGGLINQSQPTQPLINPGDMLESNAELSCGWQLKDLRVHEVTDIISLKSRNHPNAPASFCIVVDNLNDNMQIVNQDSCDE